MNDVDAAFLEQVFDIAKREREPGVHHHRQVDDLRRDVEVAKRVGHRTKSEPPRGQPI